MPSVARVFDKCKSAQGSQSNIEPPGAASVVIGDLPAGIAGGQFENGSTTVFAEDGGLIRVGDSSVSAEKVISGCDSVEAD